MARGRRPVPERLLPSDALGREPGCSLETGPAPPRSWPRGNTKSSSANPYAPRGAGDAARVGRAAPAVRHRARRRRRGVSSGGPGRHDPQRHLQQPRRPLPPRVAAAERSPAPVSFIVCSLMITSGKRRRREPPTPTRAGPWRRRRARRARPRGRASPRRACVAIWPPPIVGARTPQTRSASAASTVIRAARGR